MRLRGALVIVVVLGSAWQISAWGQSGEAPGSLVIPPGTPLPVKIAEHLPMKAGEAVRAQLLYPVYADDKMVLPAGTVVTGTVVALRADHTRRVHARLRGDFTPFHIPVVQFTSATLADGKSMALSTGTATDGAPVYRLVAPPQRKGGFMRQQFGMLKQAAKDRIAVVTGPNKGDRLLQLLYSQLPYHPERIAKDTAWTVETTSPVAMPEIAPPAAVARTAVAADSARPTWIVQAYLQDSMSSATSKPGQTIKAVVAEPILNPDGTVAVPQGSVLSGSVTQARPARSFARVGELRFSFRELTLPGAEPQAVQAQMTGADSSNDMAMNSEGEVKPKAQDKLLVPLILFSLAARPLDRDGGRHMLRKDASASNSVGVLGFILGTVAKRPNLAAGLGYYGAAISVYERWFHRGKEVAFAKDTRVVIQTTARRTQAIKPTAQP
jgi:hypothetical protein